MPSGAFNPVIALERVGIVIWDTVPSIYSTKVILRTQLRMAPKKIILCIGKQHGLLALEAFLRAKNEIEVLKVYTFQEKPHEPRKENPAIISRCQENNIPCAIGSPSVEEISSSGCDLLLAIKWRYLFKREVYEAPRVGTFAIHDSLLPRYRGASPLNWCIINGEKEVGATLFRVDDGVDTGSIIEQRSFPIGENDRFQGINDRMAQCYAEICEAFARNASSEAYLRGRSQQNELATYCCRRSPSDGEINWSLSAREIHDFIRGQSFPAPGAYTWLDGQKVIINASRLHQEQDAYVGRIPGKIIRLSRKNGWSHILCGRGILEIIELSVDGAFVPSTKLFSSIATTLGTQTK